MSNLDSLTLLEIMAAHSDDIRVDRITLEMTKDLSSAVILSRLVYWFSPSKKTGQKRTRILREGKSWVAKADSDWWDECGITAKQMKRIKPLLISLGVMNVKVWKFDGLSTTHYHLDIEAYSKLYQLTAENMVSKKDPLRTKGTKGKVPKVQRGRDKRDRPITEELDNEIYTKDLKKDRCHPGLDARLLSLLQICFKEVFSSQRSALTWMMRLGLPESIAEIYLKLNLVELRAGAEYLKHYVEKNDKKKKINVPGYFRRIMDNKWHLDDKKWR